MGALPSNQWKGGFTDGDGLLTIVENRRTNRPSNALFPYIAFSLTNPTPLRLFSQEYGGKVYAKRDSEKWGGTNWAQQWSWRCPIPSCERFLRDVLPYLRLKRTQALILLELVKRRRSPTRQKRRGRGGSGRLTFEELSARRALRDRVRTLNSKGSYSRKMRITRDYSGGNDSLLESERISFPKMVLDTDLLQWLAGFFDAEGSITIEMQIRENRPSPRFTLMINVANSDVRGLHPFVAFYGGQIHMQEESRSDVRGLKWSNMYRWYCPQGSAKKFIDDTVHLLVIKRPQAILGRRFLDHTSRAPSVDRSQDGTFGRLGSDEIVARRRYYDEMVRLNSTEST